MTRDEVIALAMEVDCLHVNLTGDRDKAAERLQCFAAAIEQRVRQDDPALRLVADIRFALGDDGKRMSDELVEYCKELRRDAERYRLFRRGQHFSAINGIGDVLRADDLDAAIDTAMQTQAQNGNQHGR